MIWQVKESKLDCRQTLLMGILNITPDSFSDGGKYLSPEQALCHARQMVEEGADILDLGAESTRPGAEPVSEKQELKRLLPVLEELRNKIKIPISVDTTKPGVAHTCLEAGAHIINDVSGLKESGPQMAEVVRDFGAGLVLMHRRGTPATMQSLTQYDNVVSDVIGELQESLDQALQAGIHKNQIAIDPGIGFAKTAEQNIQILSELERFQELGCPVLLGPSRKSFIGNITGRDVSEREYGTAAVCALAVQKGISILRVHQVGPIRDAVRIVNAIEGGNYVGSFKVGKH